jgi:hypothetical protein
MQALNKAHSIAALMSPPYSVNEMFEEVETLQQQRALLLMLLLACGVEQAQVDDLYRSFGLSFTRNGNQYRDWQVALVHYRNDSLFKANYRRIYDTLNPPAPKPKQRAKAA